MKRWFFLTATGVVMAGCNEQICSPAEWYEEKVTESEIATAQETAQIRRRQGAPDSVVRASYCVVLCNPNSTCKDPVPDGGTMEVSDSGSGGAGGMSSNGGEGGASVRVEKTYTVECYREQACGPSRSPTGFF